MQLLTLFPFEVKYLDVGFKYLGYFLKPNNYIKEVWFWLVKKVEKRIGHRCNRWLTLGGIYSLVKSMMENIPVYWISLAKIPKFILDKIRRKKFSFLWVGKKENPNFHLVKW